ncbi:MAG: class I SAM-dependent methyltransferase [Planctomycetia bacterium]|nr:class I SAM-dependent methyltransferase [Planctomycetia bacterium]
MSDASQNSYDDVPYPSYPHPNTHPRHLEALAVLFGMEPPPSTACRVLELGCASGGNLIPVADESPDCQVLGIDLSSRQVEDGRATIAELGMPNIELRKADVCEIDDSWGKFDYIICFGVYSWVPPAVQDRIFDVCRRNLAPNGVASISYNTYPGWYLREGIRDLMRYHVDQISDPRQRIAQARAVLDFMVSVCDERQLHGQLLKHELKLIREVDESYLYHEHLEDYNQPTYFHEFIDRAAQHGLQYLSESNVSRMLMLDLPEKAREALREAPMIRREQYLDFLRNVGFRTTLLCHREIELDHELREHRMGRFHVQLSDRPDPGQTDLGSHEPVKFTVADRGLTVSLPLSKAAIVCLGRIWPEAIGVAELYDRALEMLEPASTADPQRSIEALHSLLASALAGNFLEIFVHPPRCVSTIADRPVASKLVRYQASRRMLITNRWHRIVKFNDVGRFVLQRLDGQHDRAALERDLHDALAKGVIVRKPGDEDAASDEPVPDMVDWALQTCASACLLVA